MAVKIKVQKPAPHPVVDIGNLRGASRKLAELVLEYGNYEFEGFQWVQGTFEGFAEQLGVNEKTVRRIAVDEPFYYITIKTPENGKHILLKLGTAPCETGQVSMLRATWVKGLAYYNGAAVKLWPIALMQAKEAKLPYESLQKRIEQAHKWLPKLEKLKAGEHISYTVKPHEMGLLRECVKQLGEDAFSTLACLTSWNGWHMFISYAKVADRIAGHYYHWPTLGPIAANPDIALQVYLETGQKEGTLDIPECARLNAKIAKLKAILAN